MRLYLLGTQIVMKSFALSDSFGDIFDPEETNLEAFLSTVKTKYFNTVCDILMAFGADHFFSGLLKARDMEGMTTGSKHERPIGSAQFALFLFVLIASPFDVVLEDEEELAFIAAAEMLDAEPDHHQQQSNPYDHHY